MKRILLVLVAASALLGATQSASAHGPRYGVRVYGGYRPYYAAYAPPYYGPPIYPLAPPPRVYYPPYPVYPAPVVSGFYGGPGFGFYFGR